MVRGIRVDSLSAGFTHVVVKGATMQGRGVRIAKLRPRDIDAMLAVVEMAKAKDREWWIINKDPIRRFEQAVGVLLALESAMIPALAVFPNDPRVMSALRTYATKLQEHASAAGGDFMIQAWELCRKLREYTNNADEQTADQLKARSDVLFREVTALLDAEVTVSQTGN